MNPYEIEGIQPGEFISLRTDHPITSFVTVSSATAKRWLAHNTHNRPLSDRARAEYQSDMEAGRFKLTGEPIQFSKTGVLLNGQNRLTALANCNPPITLVFNVIRGLDDESQRFMDLGKKRSPGQQLGLLEVKNSNQVGALARLMIIWENDNLWDGSRTARAISTPRVEQWVLDNEKLISLFNRYLSHATRNCGGTASVAGAMGIAAMRADVPAAIAFFHLLHSKVGLPLGSPLVALDQRLRRTRIDRKRLAQREELAYFISAWNAWMRGDSVTKVQAGKGGWSKGNFPELVTFRGPGFNTEQLEMGLDMAGFEG